MAISEPILILAFNRPWALKRLLDRLRESQPERLYVAIDGPRPDRPQDAALVRECQDLVDAIDWETDLTTLFQVRNLGCGLGVSTALTWFFKSEERGIILEDDILPSRSFFGFCAELLDRYADDERVLAISGCNFVPQNFQTDPNAPYRFSRVPHIWGWATWRRSWELHSLDMSNWRERMTLLELWRASGSSLSGMMFWKAIFEAMARGQVDTWDMQFVFEGMQRRMLTATSNVNLIENIGFDTDATHTRIRPAYLQPARDVHLPVRQVPVTVDEKADRWSREVVFEATFGGLARQAYRYLRRSMVPNKG